MNSEIKVIFDEILEKKFNKAIQAGYDPLDVDMFLDYVRQVILQVHQYIEQQTQAIDYKNNEIKQLLDKLSEKKKEIKFLQQEIDSLKQDGYYSQHTIKSIGKLQKDVYDLKNVVEKSKNQQEN